MKFILFCVKLDLSDNLTETRIVKNSNSHKPRTRKERGDQFNLFVKLQQHDTSENVTSLSESSFELSLKLIKFVVNYCATSICE